MAAGWEEFSATPLRQETPLCPLGSQVRTFGGTGRTAVLGQKATFARLRSPLSLTLATPLSFEQYRWKRVAKLRSASDPIDSRLALDATQRRVELLDTVTRQQLANGGGRIEGFRETDFAGVGE